jgi:hypothetical protein
MDSAVADVPITPMDFSFYKTPWGMRRDELANSVALIGVNTLNTR